MNVMDLYLKSLKNNEKIDIHNLNEGFIDDYLDKKYKEIEVEYMDINFNKQHGKYNGFIAEIIQHEIDHTNGIII